MGEMVVVSVATLAYLGLGLKVPACARVIIGWVGAAGAEGGVDGLAGGEWDCVGGDGEWDCVEGDETGDGGGFGPAGVVGDGHGLSRAVMG